MEPFLQLRNIAKSFGGVKALNDVSVDFNLGEIHVVIGENGAGKSTLMKIAAGLYRQDSGVIILDGKEVRFTSPLDAIGSRISMIHQELSPIPYLTVAQNIFLGREPLTKIGLLDKKGLLRKTRMMFEEIGLDIDPAAEMRTLSTAQMQLVEIAKAVSFNSKMLIMDEPTSALSEREIEGLYELIFKLKTAGVAIVFISHKLDEVFRVAERMTVLRDGCFIGSRPASDFTKDSLIAMMIGRDLDNIYTKYAPERGDPVLEVKNLTKDGLFRDISFTLHKGEILGFAGLMGAGRTELAETIFGMRRATSGQIFINGKEAKIRNPWDAKRHRLALIPEDRKMRGLNHKATTGFNISICDLDEFSVLGVLTPGGENKRVDGMISELGVKVDSRKTPVTALSGGNQQKVVIAKWLMTSPDILIMDEPTRGIDIGAKTEIYKLIADLVKNGKSIIMVSSELPEIIGMSDRVIVLSEGKMTAELSGSAINQAEIMRMATG
jgi:ABC-type sugar transport system ATPase subunit